MSKYWNKDVGRVGEEIARDYLLTKNYELITQNFQTRFGEIDLICKDGDSLVFVEVKTKKGLEFGSPEEMFTTGKYQRVKRMATVYLGGKESQCRIDMVAVVLGPDDQLLQITHYPNVVL